MIEHRSEVEVRERSEHVPIGPRSTYIQIRYVCACGWTTQWTKVGRSARDEQRTHALDGQLSADWSV